MFNPLTPAAVDSGLLSEAMSLNAHLLVLVSLFDQERCGERNPLRHALVRSAVDCKDTIPLLQSRIVAGTAVEESQQPDAFTARGHVGH